MARRHVVLDQAWWSGVDEPGGGGRSVGRRASSPAADVFVGRAAYMLVPGRSMGGPARLSGRVVDVFVHCERQGVTTVVLAGEAADLDTPAAAVSRYVATDQQAVAAAAAVRFGAERVHLAATIDVAQARALVAELPFPGRVVVPAGRRLRGFGGRTARRVDRIVPIRALYGKIRGRDARSRGAGREASGLPS
ncbi:hypothetical protein [Phytoactinopolyspora limicola]|uniref:hypothetical protein n=1 Tax=Phytoactinopolyspora limicola TaxID=2715536 RepID=UPI0014087B36|nr:hypothetical protein [Phytoactinopolyspora limicola]